MTSTNRIHFVMTLFVVLAVTACATVPEEAVNLSRSVGADITQLQSGYRETVRLAFKQMRQKGLSVIDNVWTPAFLKGSIPDVLAAAQNEQFQTQLVEFWARKTIGKIDAKRKAFLDPIQVKEYALLALIDVAFDEVISANAAVTAHLSSIVKVQKQQGKALAAAGLPADLRTKIQDAIIKTTAFANNTIKDIDAATKILDPPVQPN